MIIKTETTVNNGVTTFKGTINGVVYNSKEEFDKAYNEYAESKVLPTIEDYVKKNPITIEPHQFRQRRSTKEISAIIKDITENLLPRYRRLFEYAEEISKDVDFLDKMERELKLMRIDFSDMLTPDNYSYRIHDAVVDEINNRYNFYNDMCEVATRNYGKLTTRNNFYNMIIVNCDSYISSIKRIDENDAHCKTIEDLKRSIINKQCDLAELINEYDNQIKTGDLITSYFEFCLEKLDEWKEACENKVADRFLNTEKHVTKEEDGTSLTDLMKQLFKSGKR